LNRELSPIEISRSLPDQGVFVAVHNTNEEPLISHSGILIRKNMEALFELGFQLTSLDKDAAKSTDPLTRGCLQNKEVFLKYLDGYKRIQ